MMIIPCNPTEEDYAKAYLEGMLHKDKLVVGATYSGWCRNATEAIWDGERFSYIRTKFGHSYSEHIKYPTDEQRYDVFIPIRRIG